MSTRPKRSARFYAAIVVFAMLVATILPRVPDALAPVGVALAALLQSLHGASGPAVLLGVLLFAAVVTGGIGVLLSLIDWFGRRRVPMYPDPAWVAQIRRSVRR